MKPLPQSLFSFLFLLSMQNANAAACCGGGASTPSIIVGDDKAQLTGSYSYTEVIIDNVDTSGVWRKWDEHQQVQTYLVEGAHLISDRWQTGFSLPVIQRSRRDETYSGLGDVTGTIAYEYLPDWDYNPIRPKGIGFLQLTLPTGRARAESDVGGLDSRGNGFWALGIGTLLTKNISKYDLFTSLEVHRAFPKTFSNSQMSGTLQPGYGGNLGVGGGYNLKSWRIGAAVTWTYEDPIDISGSTDSRGSAERYATSMASLTYLKNDSWSGTVSYSDQTLFGDPTNTSLGRSLVMQMKRRWGR